ncbi:MAG: DNA polymerase I [Bacteroidota bacterium]
MTSAPTDKKKLFLLDAFALIYRSYFAFANNPRINSKGLNTSAIFGFTNTLLEILNKEKPTHIAVVFDTAAKTQRHVDFTEYKANREEMPEDLSLALPYIFKLIEGFNIATISYDGFEADDVIGTLAKKAEQHGYITYMMTPDKDYGQLVSENIFIYKPARMGNGAEILGVEEICKKWEIERVDQVIDILGLMGDKVDNIPGIPGVGEKTAMQLIKDFGSIENVLQNTDKLKGKLKEKVEANVDKAILSKKLATIIIDVPVDVDEEQLIRKDLNKEMLSELFKELEFRQLASRLLGEDIPGKLENESATKKKKDTNQIDMFALASDTSQEAEATEEPVVYKTAETVLHNYILVTTAEERTELVNKLMQQKSVCFDTETTDLDTFFAELVGMSFSFKENEAYYVAVPADKQEAQQIANEFKPFFESESIEKIAQNIKYDYMVLLNYGVTVKGKWFDTMLAHYLIQPDMRHGMDVLAETYLGYQPIQIDSLIGKKGKNQLSMRDVELEKIKEYAAEDADVTFQLKQKFEPLLNETFTKSIFETVEIPLVPVLAQMEAEGVNVDVKSLEVFSQELATDIAVIEKEIIELAGTNFNIASPKQLGDILFEVLKIDEKAKKTKTGQYATGEEVLAKLVNKHPIINKILDFRELVKLKNTYVDALPLLINSKTGRIHTSYNQAVAATGRLSSNNPNLQNIPIRTEKGRLIRKAFIPRNQDSVLLSADYSQIELRVIASLSGDAGMIEAFNNHEDIHTATAAKVWNVPFDEVTKDMRSKAKTVNFGIIYGISAFGLSERINISRTEAKEIIEQYFEKYAGVKKYMDESILKAKKDGFVETMLGRRRYLRDINSANAVVRGFAERNAINAPIQGTAADMIKIAMINTFKALNDNGFKSKMILQVHDELVFDVYKNEVETIKPLIKENMQNAIKLAVPLEVELGSGINWLEAH